MSQNADLILLKRSFGGSALHAAVFAAEDTEPFTGVNDRRQLVPLHRADLHVNSHERQYSISSGMPRCSFIFLNVSGSSKRVTLLS